MFTAHPQIDAFDPVWDDSCCENDGLSQLEVGLRTVTFSSGPSLSVEIDSCQSGDDFLYEMRVYRGRMYSIRELSVDLSNAHPAPTTAQLDAWTAHMLKLINLSTLVIRQSSALVSRLASHSYSGLACVTLSPSPAIWSFLANHTQLREIHIKGRVSQSLLGPPPYAFSTLTFPELEILEGPPTLARAVIPRSKVHTVTLHMESDRAPAAPHDPTEIAFLAASHATVTALKVYTPTWASPPLAHIAWAVPNLRALELRTDAPARVAELEAFVDAMRWAGGLWLLKHVRCLTLGTMAPVPSDARCMSAAQCEVVKDRMVSSWPTLLNVELPQAYQASRGKF
ncbi:unnamed protein product [Mycena citricolor]|uniref:Uncharacterized protein n=1 Tax=Mycena citricolor TaxID=2018698 RepID=A0AAD2HQ71_9AGAR|nr:unnamed protein product [Mycena citricolor]